MKAAALLVTLSALAVVVIMRLSKKNMNPAKTSRAGIEAIKIREGFRARMYLDSAGKATIGYGHLIKPGEKFEVITLQAGEQLLANDLKIAESAINNLVKKEITQGQYDALASFIFNVGVNAFSKSSMLQKINKADFDGAKAEFIRWDKITDKISGQKIREKGLTYRREQEAKQFV